MKDTAEPALYGAVDFDPYGKPKIGDWIQTYTKRRFHLLDAEPDDFDIEDIAHALSNQCRFTGHVDEFYSVAEHCVRVALICEPNLQFQGLMHDASEAYLCDIARPFKHLPEFSFYREIEDKMMALIAQRFKFPWPVDPSVKRADEILLTTEARDLMAPLASGWHFREPALAAEIRPWTPRKAKREFLDMYEDLVLAADTRKAG
jgi:uncharacterized protein